MILCLSVWGLNKKKIKIWHFWKTLKSFEELTRCFKINFQQLHFEKLQMDFSSDFFASTIKKAIYLNSKKNWFNLERAEKNIQVWNINFTLIKVWNHVIFRRLRPFSSGQYELWVMKNLLQKLWVVNFLEIKV